MRYKLLSNMRTDNTVCLGRTRFSYPDDLPEYLRCFYQVRRSCGEWCPMFEVEKTTAGLRVILSCVPNRRIIMLDEED